MDCQEYRLWEQTIEKCSQSWNESQNTHNIHLLILDFFVDLDDPHQRESCNTKRISIVFKRCFATPHEKGISVEPRRAFAVKTFGLNYSNVAGVVDTLIQDRGWEKEGEGGEQRGAQLVPVVAADFRVTFLRREAPEKPRKRTTERKKWGEGKQKPRSRRFVKVMEFDKTFVFLAGPAESFLPFPARSFPQCYYPKEVPRLSKKHTDTAFARRVTYACVADGNAVTSFRVKITAQTLSNEEFRSKSPIPFEFQE